MRKPVYLESPFAPGDFVIDGDIGTLGRRKLGVNHTVMYARLAMFDSIANFYEAPLLPHLLYTQVLDDTKPTERQMGLSLGEAWKLDTVARSLDTVFYCDLGFSAGMKAALVGLELDQCKFRTLPPHLLLLFWKEVATTTGDENGFPSSLPSVFGESQSVREEAVDAKDE